MAKKAFFARAALKMSQWTMRKHITFNLAGRLAALMGRQTPFFYKRLAALTGWGGYAPAPKPAMHSFGKLWRHWQPPGRISPSYKLSAEPSDDFKVHPEYKPDQLALFLRRFSEAGGEVVSTQNAAETILEIVTKNGQGEVIVDESAVKSGFDRHLFDDGQVFLSKDDIPLSRENAPKARYGLTGCSCLVAETGSILLSHDNDVERIAPLLPEIHIVLAKLTQIVPTLEEALFIRDKSGFGVASLITGPSRTSDIEKTLILGMHGPRRVILVLSY